MKTSRPIFSLLIVTVSAILAIVAAGCGTTGYKTFSIKEGVQAFNFEYPETYKLVRIDMSNMSDSQYTTIGLGTTTNGAVSEIYVYVWPTSADLLTASATLDTLLSNAASVLTDFALVKKSATSVNGQVAQGAVFTAIQSDSSTATTEGPAYYRVTCFIHGEWIIEIDMTCDVSLKDVTQNEYDHLLETFAALD